MIRLALATLACSLLAAAFRIAAGRRRRGAGGELRVDPIPAGLQHLASRVAALSSLGMDLTYAPQRGVRRRILPLLGVR